ncbi:GntR family transcriptional regulator [Eubacteriaceae bacterium ES3]|nr:GntR family transcriptional regulator [Eubacteriaceae bacterium ES3]
MSQIQSLRDHVCSYIHEKIKDGGLVPHEKLSEAQICSDLKISRTPAREALIMLATEHIIDYVPRKGFYVKKITVEDMLEYYSLMSNLDAFAASLAIDHLTQKDYQRMEELIAKTNLAIEYDNLDDFIALQEAFHQVYISKSHNTPLIETIASLSSRYIPLTYNKKKVDQKTYKELLYKSNEGHKKMLDYFINREKNLLADYIKTIHWETTDVDFL